MPVKLAGWGSAWCPVMGVGRVPAVWLFVVVGEGLRGSLPAGSDLPAPGCLGVEGLLFTSSIPSSGDARGWGSQAGLGVLAIGVAMVIQPCAVPLPSP